MAFATTDNFAMKEKKGPYKHQRSTDGSVIAKKYMKLFDVKLFSPIFWVLALAISLFYSIVFPFMADSSSFLQRPKFHLNNSVVSFRAGLV